MKSREVLKNIGISRGTLVKYVKEGIIKTDAKINGQYVYNDESVFKLIGCKKKKYKRINITYARCSNPPKKYVSEQSIRILNFCSSKGIQIEKQIEDIKSGMNFDRDGLNELLKLVIENKVELIIIENKDELLYYTNFINKEFNYKEITLKELDRYYKKWYDKCPKRTQSCCI